MKKGVVVFASLALLLGCTCPVFAQFSTKAVETRVIDTFDNVGENEWTWNVVTSNGIADGYPKFDYFDGQPNTLRVMNENPDVPHKVLGVQVSYKRKGENWFEVYPVKDGEAYEIPLVGQVTMLDFWMWGANYKYFIDVMIRDTQGRVYTLPAGNLFFNGWKNVIIDIPTHITQSTRMRSGPKQMTFVGFRIHTDPNEWVDDFSIFFDQLKFTTNIMKNIYDGYDLRYADFGESSGSAESSEGK